jgi:hypothetical protein
MQTPANTELERISEFKGGISQLLERQETHARILRQVFSSSVVSGEERLALQDVSVNIDRTITQLQGLIREASIQLNASNLDQEARKAFHNFFSADMTAHRVTYVSFLLQAVHSKRFALEASELWGKIRGFLDRAKISTSSQLREQAVKYRVDPAMADLEGLRTLAERMGRVVRFKQDPLSVKNLSGIGSYSPGISYQLSVVFREDLDDYVKEQSVDVDSSALAIMDDLTVASPKVKAPPLTIKESEFVLRATGKQAWNSSSSYQLAYDPTVLEEEKERFREVVYIDTHLGALQDVIRTDFVRQYSRKQRFMSPEKVEADYRTFLYVFFNLATDISILNAGIKAEYRNAFLFHLGPKTFFQLSKRYLKELSTGTMHRVKGSGRMIERFVPLEFVKAMIIEWWREELIPASSEEDREDPGLYRAMVKVMKQRMDSLSEAARKEFESVTRSSRAQDNKEQLLKELIQRKIGPTNMVVFKRFLAQP